MFAWMMTRADLHARRVHNLRHTFASLLLPAGAPITYASKQLGHPDASITLRVYAHHLPDPWRKDVDLLDVQPSATAAQPEPFSDDVMASEFAELFGKNGEPQFRELELAPQVVAAG